MKQQQLPLFRKHWYIIDQSLTGLGMNPVQSFAYDDTLCRIVAEQPDWGIARTWVHDKTIVLGIQDSRLPHVEDGIQFLKNQGYNVIVRNSGGLAVVLDEEVLNLSIMLKDSKTMSIDYGYELMVALTKSLLEELGGGESGQIVDGEIKESYCPGRYDLSIFGKKFAGISQRRLRGGVAVQIYMAVRGSGSTRAELIRQFYEHAVKGMPTKYEYPKIVPDKMASLEELGFEDITIQKLVHTLLLKLHAISDELSTYEFKAEDWNHYEANLKRILKRNEKMT
ncbi:MULTISPECIES: lipoate--protein ligase family protein [Bacillaceae]|uniref:Octanoyl-[GcvH]:protein N-octanoyltransferase n=1 Tax=Evansella alkalicola TaxID=745819 RepID=A0ABS6K0Q7_9BACI|nr:MULTISPECIES: biotin/lipoate A/B protein ligase family protein [Bacillaceae]MBU9724308.1 lipoate--protein ligase family protein [Bacillus alkalicola]